jgi:hypothetical protein
MRSIWTQTPLKVKKRQHDRGKVVEEQRLGQLGVALREECGAPDPKMRQFVNANPLSASLERIQMSPSRMLRMTSASAGTPSARKGCPPT